MTALSALYVVQSTVEMQRDADTTQRNSPKAYDIMLNACGSCRGLTSRGGLVKLEPGLKNQAYLPTDLHASMNCEIMLAYIIFQ